MNKPILVIDEAPFVKHIRRTDDFIKFEELKFRLKNLGIEHEVEFFYDDGLEKGGVPKDKNSKEFKDLFSNRKFIFGHNSYPEGGAGEVPLLEEKFFSDLFDLTDQGCVMVRFSGSRRGKFSFKQHPGNSDLSWDNPLNYKEIQIGRHEVYSNLDRFVFHSKRCEYQYPIYELLTKEFWTLEDVSKEYINKIYTFLYEEGNSLSSLVGQSSKFQPKANWKELIGKGPFLFYLSLFSESIDWRKKIFTRLEEKKPTYKNPADYVEDLKLLLKKLKK